MNLIEFMFAVTAVFGSTGVIVTWTSFTYNLERNEQKNKKKTIRIAK